MLNLIKTGSLLDREQLKGKVQLEYSFISGVLDRVPAIYWQETGDDVSEDINNTADEGCRLMRESRQTPRAQTIEELQERLEAMKAIKKQGYRDLVSKKILKAKLKKKKKADEKNIQRKQMKMEKQALKSSKNGSVENNTDHKPSKPVFNNEGKMVFSKFDFSEIGSHKEEKKKKKELKDPRKILEKLKEKKETLKKLKDEGQIAKAQEIKQKEAWNNALKKAEGIKVKDNPELLKKTLKREEARKKQSAKKWASREHSKKKSIQERQQKRESNIQARKDLVKKQKRSKAIKKGRIVPGF